MKQYNPELAFEDSSIAAVDAVLATMMAASLVAVLLFGILIGRCISGSTCIVKEVPVKECVKEVPVKECRTQEYWLVEGAKTKLHIFKDCGSLKHRTDITKLVLCQHALTPKDICEHCESRLAKSKSSLQCRIRHT